MRPNRALLLSKRTDRLPLGTGLLVAARRPLTWLTVAVTLCVAAPAAARSDQTRFSAPTGLFTTLDYGAEPADFEAALEAIVDQGFAGDTHRPLSGKYFGDLAWDRGY